MKSKWLTGLVLVVLSVSAAGCVETLLLGVAAGGVGMYAAGKDTIQGDTDTAYDQLWDAAIRVCRIKGTIKQDNYGGGNIEVEVSGSKVWVRFSKLTAATTRIRVSSRNKLHMPNINLAQDMLIKILEEAKTSPAVEPVR
ncbi:MAG: DUF3568 family protein [Candidatus Omnitrophica bacterium]|jgi:hypothetical protein|nr:DUF3568 domain-containing protein [Candidatus Omnitrophota bacterium]MDD5079373.1 DUF3568 family protein [Candidatus Omnitrophota bacterium]